MMPSQPEIRFMNILYAVCNLTVSVSLKDNDSESKASILK